MDILDSLFGRFYPMSRIFAYDCVSATKQTTKNQIYDIVAAGFRIEHDLLIERRQSGVKRAKPEGKTRGCFSVLNEEQKPQLRADPVKEMSVPAIASKCSTSRQTFMQVWDKKTARHRSVSSRVA